MTILIALDFDGVVSPIPESGPKITAPNFRTYTLTGFPVSIHKDVLDFLHELDGMDDVEVRWVSSWNDCTEVFCDGTSGDIPDFGYLDVSTGKATVVLDAATRYDTVIHCEDSSKIHREVRAGSADNIVSVKTSIARGLTKADMDMIRKVIVDHQK